MRRADWKTEKNENSHCRRHRFADSLMQVVQDPLFYAVAIPAVLLAGISKGGFAGGLGILAIPLMSIIISPVQAAGIMLPILCVMDLAGARMWRNLWDRNLMRRLLPGALLGILAGYLTFHLISDAVLKCLIGLLALAFTLNYCLKGRVRSPLKLPEPVSGWLWSSLSGYTSFLSHAGGPPIMIYLLPKQLEKRVLVATLTIFFAVVNYVKLIPYAMLGQLNIGNLVTSALLAPIAVVGVSMGIWLHDRIDEKLFYRLSYGFLLLTGLKLTWDGLTRLTV
jgi:uncharacterized membrane protein YfcA